MTQLRYEIEDLDDVVIELGNLTELIGAAKDILNKQVCVDSQGRRIHALDTVYALLSIARDKSVETLAGLEAAYADERQARKAGAK